jgi:aminoglycoside phosphotransferase (APT) family kinase protein
MHPGELPIDEPLVRTLLAEQFPQWSELPLALVEPWGTVNAIYRLGDDLSVRLPRLTQWSADERELEWLPHLAPQLPLAMPVPVARGAPTADYPCHWLVATWVEGEHAPVDPVQAGRDLAAFVEALQGVDPTGAPAGRGVPMPERDGQVRAAIEAWPDARVAEIWDGALAAPPWDDPPVWAHGDLDARNWLVRDGRVCGVIDWGSFGVGDPAVDVMVAWKLRSAAGRTAFREAISTDDATWRRARGWAVSQAVMALSYYTIETNRTLVLEARAWLDEVLTDIPLQLAEYDSEWPAQYARVERVIGRAIGARAVVLEHAGSTSVPGLAAKPRIDIVLGVADSADEASYVPALEEAGFYLRIREPEWHEHRLLRAVAPDVNLHVFGVGSAEIERMLRFRDRLRTHDDERELYERTKRELAAREWRYTQEYADAKTAVVEAILERE